MAISKTSRPIGDDWTMVRDQGITAMVAWYAAEYGIFREIVKDTLDAVTRDLWKICYERSIR